MASDLSDLDLQEVVAAPLLATAEAQLRTALAVVELVRDLALGEEAGAARLRSVDFAFEREVLDAEGRPRRVKRTVQVPLLAMLSLPNLEIDRVEYRCRVRINRTEAARDVGTMRLPPALVEKYPFLRVRERFRVAPAARRATRREGEVSGPWDVEISVIARNEEPAEGTDRLLTVLAAALREGEEEA